VFIKDCPYQEEQETEMDGHQVGSCQASPRQVGSCQASLMPTGGGRKSSGEIMMKAPSTRELVSSPDGPGFMTRQTEHPAAEEQRGSRTQVSTSPRQAAAFSPTGPTLNTVNVETTRNTLYFFLFCYAATQLALPSTAGTHAGGVQ